MKKKISFLVFLAIGSVVLMASYRYQDPRAAKMNALTAHPWKFQGAESSSEQAAFVINSLYYNAVYNFTTTNEVEGSFFEKPVYGTWSFVGENKIVINKGTLAEEVYEINELTSETLKMTTTEKGEHVMLSYSIH